MSAVRAYMTQGERMYDGLVNLGDTAGLLEQKSATMAATLKANLQNLQTAFLSFADKNLTGPLHDLTLLLNRLAEDPKKIEEGIKGITRALFALGALRIGGGIVSFIANVKSIFSKGKVDFSGLTGATGGAGLPVYVTNLGSGGSVPGGNGTGLPVPGLPAKGVPKGVPQAVPAAPSLLSKAGPYAAFAAMVLATSMAIDKAATKNYQVDGKHHSEWGEQAEYASLFGDRARELEARIAQLTIEIPEYEKLRAGFGADEQFQHVGFSGEYEMVTLGGLRARLIGLQEEMATLESSGIHHTAHTVNNQPVNDLILTPQGRFSTHPDDYIIAMKNPAALMGAGTPLPNQLRAEIRNEVRAVERIPPALPPVVVEGVIELHSDLAIDDRGYRLRQSVGKNTTPYKFAVGSANNARLIQ
jgi:hypothetical protein